jgi:hypothetical protein
MRLEEGIVAGDGFQGFRGIVLDAKDSELARRAKLDIDLPAGNALGA